MFNCTPESLKQYYNTVRSSSFIKTWRIIYQFIFNYLIDILIINDSQLITVAMRNCNIIIYNMNQLEQFLTASGDQSNEIKIISISIVRKSNRGLSDRYSYFKLTHSQLDKLCPHMLINFMALFTREVSQCLRTCLWRGKEFDNLMDIRNSVRNICELLEPHVLKLPDEYPILSVSVVVENNNRPESNVLLVT